VSDDPAGDPAPQEPTEADTIEALVTLGVPPDVAAEAVASDRVALTLVQALSNEPRPYSFEDVVSRTGVPPDVLRERYRALGLPEHRQYGEDELREAERLREILDLLPAKSLVHVIRYDGQALHRVVLAHLDAVYEEFVNPLRREGAGDIAVALALAEAYRSLKPIAGDLLRFSYDRILEQLLTSELIAAVTRAGSEDMTLAVGFADVVGYTSLSARIDPGGLEEVIAAFETRCYTIAGTLEDVQLVKFLGDAAMLVATEPTALATALLAIAVKAEDDSPLAGSPIRCGMAHGPVLMRGGDYYGATVNLAARLTDRARAGRVLAAGDLADDLAGFEVRRTGWMHLRGIGRHRPITVRLPRPER
jgi:adenylate cyclase